MNLLTSLIFTLLMIANDETILVIGVRPFKEYGADGKPTDKIGGYQYECICPKNKYANITIKVAEKKPSITQEYIEEQGEVVATPIDFVGRFYRANDGEYRFSAKASAMKKEV